jgi:hypothetical protein
MRSFEYFVAECQHGMIDVLESTMGEWLTSIASHFVMLITAAFEPQ